MNRKTLEKAGARLFNLVCAMQKQNITFHHLTGDLIDRPDEIIQLYADNYVIITADADGNEKHFLLPQK